MSETAKGTFEVSLQPMEFEGVESRWKLGRMSIDKRISGDLTATTKGQMITAMTDTEGSAGYVAIERVTGMLRGKRGSFVLQHSGLMNRGAQSLSIVVSDPPATALFAGT